MRKHIKRSVKRDLKMLHHVSMSKVKSILKASRKAILLEKRKTIAHLRWITDFKLRHKLDIRNKSLFKKYIHLARRLRRFEASHSMHLKPVRS